jgi:peptide/nickel transport system permease protein
MMRSILRRVLVALLVVWGVTLITFALARVLPGNPVYLMVGDNADSATIAATEARLGLDKSIPAQYLDYASALLRGDLGTSLTTRNPVTDDLAERLPATLELALVALALTVVLSLAVGVRAARRPRGVCARLADGLSAAGVAVPQFWLGLMLIYVFFYLLGWFPAPLGRYPSEPEPTQITGFLLLDTLLEGDLGAWLKVVWTLVLPAVVLALTAAPPLLRLVQVQLREALESDTIRAARAVGLPERQVVWHDAMRMIVAPLLNMTVITFGALVGSAVLVEVVFSWPGIGQYSVQAINASDYPAIQGVVLVSAVMYVGLFLLVDLAQTAIDPRLRGRG